MQDHSAEQTQRLGATLQQAGEQSMRTNQEIGLRIQNELDDANVKAAETKFIQASTDRLHGQNGYMNTRGSDAINQFEPAQQDIIKAKKDILDSLGNEIQKHMFNQVATQHLVTFGGQMSQHQNQQRVEYSATQAASRADSMRTMAMNADIGSKDQNVSIEVGVNEIKEALRIKGIPADSDEAKKAERSFRSQITQDNVSRLMEDGKYEDANKLLTEQMKAGNVEGDTADRLRRAIRGNLQRTENITKSEEIFAPYQNKDLRATDLEAMLQTAQKIDNPEQREHVQDLVRAKYNEQHTMQANKYRDNYNDVANFKAQYGTLKGIDPVKWGSLNPQDQADLTKPEAQKTDLGTLYDFITKPDTLTVANVKQAWATGKLAKGEFLSLTERAMTAEKQGKSYVQEAGDIQGRIDYLANRSGIKTYGTQTPEDKAKHGALSYAVQNDIERVKQQNHGKITGDQVDQIINKELITQTFTTPGWFWRNKVTLRNFELMKVPGSDGKMHWSDGKNDLGVVE